jgi:hypothetical protein
METIGQILFGTVLTEKFQKYINPLNAELNFICRLLVLLGNLTFMGPYIVSIFQYISNKMQTYTVYLYLETALHVSGGSTTRNMQSSFQILINCVTFHLDGYTRILEYY